MFSFLERLTAYTNKYFPHASYDHFGISWAFYDKGDGCDGALQWEWVTLTFLNWFRSTRAATLPPQASLLAPRKSGPPIQGLQAMWPSQTSHFQD